MFQKISLLIFVMTGACFAQSEPVPFSHKGIKGSFGFGNYDHTQAAGLDENAAGSFAIGYGFKEHTTLWFGLSGGPHPRTEMPTLETNFFVVELQFEYKFLPKKKIQPFGKAGVGFAGLLEQESVPEHILLGIALTFSFGADYFFSRHFGVGAEFRFLDIEYVREEFIVDGQTTGKDLNPGLNRDVTGFMLRFVVQ